MPSPYRKLLEELRQSFPQPVSDRVHDSYVAHTFMRALDHVDQLKSHLPVLGPKHPLNYGRAREAELLPDGLKLEEVTEELVQYLRGSSLWGHPRNQVNVCPPPTVASLVAKVLAGLANPNMVWDEVSHRFALAEVEVTATLARMVGFDPHESTGVFTFGGTGCTLYAVRAGLEKALPDAMRDGLTGQPVVLGSECGHYCLKSVAGWLGLGTRNVVLIPTDARNQMRMDLLEDACRSLIAAGRRIACLVVTSGTTDSFGLDDLEAVVALRDRLVRDFELDYAPHIHADAVIGWAWSVFRSYDFAANPLAFRPRTLRALAATVERLKGLDQADSVGVDFHKTGFVPYISSLVLFRRQTDLLRLSRTREDMPYLFQTGEYHPGKYTLETSRSADGALSALANLRLFGRSGLQALLGHLVEMAQVLRENLEAKPQITILNRDNFGPVTLFRVYPPGVDTFKVHEREFADAGCADELERHNEYNRRLGEFLHEEAMSGRGILLGQSDCYRHTPYGKPIVALKSYLMSPFVEESHLTELVDKVLQAQAELEARLAGC